MYMLKTTAKSQINKIRRYKERIVKKIQLIKNKKEKERGKQRMEKRYSKLLIITEMQIKSTIRCHLTLVRIPIIRKSTNNKC